VSALADGAFSLSFAYRGRPCAYPYPLKAGTGVPRKSCDFLGEGALPLKADALPLIC